MDNYLKILELTAQGDASGFELLYKYYGRPLYEYAVDKWHLNEDDGWEVVYKTLESLVLKLGGYNFTSQLHFDNFIYKVFINNLRQFFRSSRNKEDHHIKYVVYNEEDSSFGAAGEIEKKAVNDYFRSDVDADNVSGWLLTVKQALAQMPEDERDLLLLKAQNYTYEEIAVMLGVQNKSLNVKHLRAKKKLTALVNKINS